MILNKLAIILTLSVFGSQFVVAETKDCKHSKEYHSQMLTKLNKRNKFLNTKFPKSKAAPVYHANKLKAK